MSDNLVQIGKKKALDTAEVSQPQGDNSGGISRRKFLKILGAASAAGAVGCADKASQNILPNFQGSDQQIPGVAIWYKSTCTECSAGCGVSVRTREGHAVKVEGNSEHPINRGGLCALGQSSLQAQYDPDRVRQPLKRDKDDKGNVQFKPISWADAYAKISKALKDSKKKNAFITNELNGSIENLVNDFSAKFSAEHITYDLLQPTALCKASEMTFGTYGIPTYKIDKAETVLNFGSDFLETWVSPVEYARDWSISRKNTKPLKLIHVEPRLSLTGANADLWLSAKPGTEVKIALAILKNLMEKGRALGLKEDVRAGIKKITAATDLIAVAEETGVGLDKILLVSEYLSSSSSSLVLAGGAAAATSDSLPLFVACNLINLVLGNLGNTVMVSSVRKPKTSLSKLTNLVENLNKNEIDVLFVHQSNPVFSLPNSYGFRYAARRASMIVSFSSSIDETSELADLILPANTSLEGWGDSMAVDGVNSLIQPAMVPIFDTKDLGTMLLEIASAAGKAFAGTEDFQAYVKESWKKVHAASGVGGDFQKFWLESLERGGYFSANKNSDKGAANTDGKIFDLSFNVASFEDKEVHGSDIILYPYPSVKSFDGRAANRPWLQELPDPITQNVWDAWAEIHPDTAKAHGLAQGDVVTIGNFYGEINVPVYLTKFVREGVVAVPIGQGHTSYGRYAKKIGLANVLELLPANGKDGVALVSTKVKLSRSRVAGTLVNVQGSDSQLGRGLAQTEVVNVSAAALAATATAAHGEDAHDDHGSHGDHGAHHEPKQMYQQREHPQYKWGMAVDLAACTGCSACVVACYAENNIPVVGKTRLSEGREMSWLRIERYYEGGSAEELQVNFLPMMCQHCGNAPCEPVCPVYATYHNEEGINAMIYNRCVGTRYCSNNCSYKVRRFNWFEYDFPEPAGLQLNPDVMKRAVGIMEKCSFCVQRITEAKDRAKDLGRMVEDGEVKPACVQSCPTQALTFGNLNDPNSKVSKKSHEARAYKILDHHLNTQPAISYLKEIRYKL